MTLKQCLAALAAGLVWTAAGHAAPQGAIGTAGVFDVNYGQFTGIYTFLENGEFYGLHFVDGNELAGHPRGLLKAQDSIKAKEPISWANFIDDAKMLGAQEKKGMFGRVFGATELTVAISGSMGSFTARAGSQRLLQGNSSTNTIYHNPVALKALVGTYAGKLRTVGFQQPMADADGLTLDAAGNVTVQTINCTFKGTIVQHGKTGIFDAVFHSSGDQCAVKDSFKGIALPLDINGASPRLAFELDTADNLKTAVFIVTRK